MCRADGTLAAVKQLTSEHHPDSDLLLSPLLGSVAPNDATWPMGMSDAVQDAIIHGEARSGKLDVKYSKKDHTLIATFDSGFAMYQGGQLGLVGRRAHWSCIAFVLVVVLDPQQRHCVGELSLAPHTCWRSQV